MISYLDGTNGDVKVATCVDVACSEPATITAVDSYDAVGLYTSVALGSDGMPVIAYRSATTQDPRVAKCGDLTCRPILPG